MIQQQTSQPYQSGRLPADIDVTAAAVFTPTDRIRWGSVIGGLFAALTTLVVLTVLGIAVGLTAYDPGDRASGFGLGAGIWAAVSALIAFGIGGCLAARTAAVPGARNGLLNGSMVWVVAIPLLLFALGGGLASLFGTATRTASQAADINVQGSGGAGGTNAQNIVDRAQDAAADLKSQVDPSQVQAATNSARNAAWGTLLSLLLGFGAAAVGGYFGARKSDHDHDADRPATAAAQT